MPFFFAARHIHVPDTIYSPGNDITKEVIVQEIQEALTLSVNSWVHPVIRKKLVIGFKINALLTLKVKKELPEVLGMVILEN